MAVSPTNNKIIVPKSGFKPVESRESRDAGKPEVAFKSDSKVEAPKVTLKGNPLFEDRARTDMYRGLSAAQKVKLISSIEKCRPQIIETYGERAYEHAVAVLLEAIEFTA